MLTMLQNSENRIFFRSPVRYWWYFFPCGFPSGVSPGLTTWRCTWRGTSKVASTLTARRADSGWPSWPVGVQRGQTVLVELTGAPPCSSQWKKMKQRRLLFAPYLVPPTPRCGDCSWKGLFAKEPGGQRETWEGGEGKKVGKNLGWKRWKETLLYGVQCFLHFFSWRIMGSPGLGVPSLRWQCGCLCVWNCECLRLDACAGFRAWMRLALWSEWHGWWWDVLHFFHFEGMGISVVSLRMNASKRFCLCQSKSVHNGGE